MACDAGFADSVVAAVERQLSTLSRSETARRSWADFGAVILVPDWQAAIPLADRIAAEHAFHYDYLERNGGYRPSEAEMDDFRRKWLADRRQ